MNERSPYDWIQGDLLKITKKHYLAKGKLDSKWPDVFCDDCILSEEVPYGTLVIALDPKPRKGEMAYTRVLYGNGVWVANSNYLMREECSTPMQENCLL